MTLLAERPTRQIMIQQAHPELRLHSDMRLAALPTAVTCAQLFTTYTLLAWRLDELLETALRCVTELVTRSVRTTGVATPHPRWTELDNLKLVLVRLLIIEQRVIIEVSDSDPTFDAAVSGDPLSVVPALCKRWNYYLPSTGGKTIWCELLLGRQTTVLDQTQGLARPLPRRVPKSYPAAEPIEVMNDPATLRRVRNGLLDVGDDSRGDNVVR
jgi:hypothetical protein